MSDKGREHFLFLEDIQTAIIKIEKYTEGLSFEEFCNFEMAVDAVGGFTEWSDIDLAIVSDAFEGSRIADRAKVRKITLGVSCDIETIPFRPEDFVVDDPFVKEILETGMRLI